jgi:hypothetical protein
MELMNSVIFSNEIYLYMKRVNTCLSYTNAHDTHTHTHTHIYIHIVYV